MRKYPQFAAGIFLHVQGQNRDQATLLPERLGDLIGDDNAVRLIDAFVDSLRKLPQLMFGHQLLRRLALLQWPQSFFSMRSFSTPPHLAPDRMADAYEAIYRSIV